MKPLVSIVITAYNAEETITYTLDSAIVQTWQRKEIIVVDKIARQLAVPLPLVFILGQPASLHRERCKTPMAPLPPPVLGFVGGSPRSGTSPLGRNIARLGDRTGLKNTGAFEDEGQFLQDVYPVDAEYGGMSRFGFDPRSQRIEGSDLLTP